MNRYVIVTVTLLCVVSFAIGRYTKQSNVKQTTQLTETTKTHEDTHTVTQTVTEKQPDGTTKTTTTTTEDTKQVETKNEQETTIDIKSAPTTNVSAIIGIDFRTTLPVYGAIATKQLLGPVTIGVFGLTNGTVGATVGINF